MSKIHAAITGVGGYVPEYRLTNQELETMVDTNDEWIQSRTGVKERRILKGERLGSSFMGIKAVAEVLEKTNTDPKDVELLICATVTPDYSFPDTANLIAHSLGMTNAFTYDLSAACSGFLFALTTGAKFIESGTYKKVIVVGADKMSSIVDYTDRSTCIIFGDGSGAVLLEPNQEGLGFQDSVLRSDGSGLENLHIKSGGSVSPPSHDTIDRKEHFIYQNGRPVFKAAVTGMANTMSSVLQRNHLTIDDINWVVPHQANIRIIEAVAEMAGAPLEKVMVNIYKYGNTTAGTIPLCLWEWEPRLKKGDKLLLTAFGGGYTWGAIYLTWAY